MKRERKDGHGAEARNARANCMNDAYGLWRGANLSTMAPLSAYVATLYGGVLTMMVMVMVTKDDCRQFD